MTAKLRNRLVFALTLAGAALSAGDAAHALTFEHISGKWCGSVSSYTFAPGVLTVTLYADNAQRKYKITDYQYADNEITVNWEREGDKLFTKFSEFSADDELMVQLKSDQGPRREFKRCS